MPVPDQAPGQRISANSQRPVTGPVPEQPEQDRSPDLELVCESGAKPGEAFALSPVRSLLGRQEPSSNFLPDIDLAGQEDGLERCTVSRLHAEIVRATQGYLVVDLGSSNGTTVNGQRLNRGEKRLLTEGDLLTIGQVALRLRVR